MPVATISPVRTLASELRRKRVPAKGQTRQHSNRRQPGRAGTLLGQSSDRFQFNVDVSERGVCAVNVRQPRSARLLDVCVAFERLVDARRVDDGLGCRSCVGSWPTAQSDPEGPQRAHLFDQVRMKSLPQHDLRCEGRELAM